MIALSIRCIVYSYFALDSISKGYRRTVRLTLFTQLVPQADALGSNRQIHSLSLPIYLSLVPAVGFFALRITEAYER